MDDRTSNSPLTRSSLFSLVLCASTCGTFMFPRGDAAQGSSQLAALGAAFIALLIPVLLADRHGGSGCGGKRRAESNVLFRVLSLPVSFGYIVRAAYIISLHADMIELYLLRRTPAAAVIAVLLLTAWFIARRGLARLAKTATLLVMLIALPMAILYVCGLYKSDPGEFLILTQPEFPKIPALLPSSLMCLSGFDCALFIRDCGSGQQSEEERKRKRGAVTAAYIATAAVAALSYVMCAGVLTVPGAEHVRFPLIETARVINLGGVILTERFDLLLVVIRVALLTMVISVYAHSACASAVTCFGNMLSTEKLLPWALVLCGVTALISQRLGAAELLRRLSIWAFLLSLASGTFGCAAGVLGRKTISDT